MNISSIKRLASLLLLGVITAGCATSTMTKQQRTEAYVEYIASENLESIKKITAFRFDSWSSLGEEHVIISTRINKAYLISLRSRCNGLSYANVIQVHNTGPTLHRNMDSISVPGQMDFRCYIDNIYPLTKDQKKALAKIGSEEKSEEKTMETAETP